ncbi:ABC transporter substrate-binding protein [SAR202 cluster bacterium AD-802-E10_MRT_200m]|nr:ABC transporter substrate-binding protein [SAR202 cluster bacterium AD-802-E10_MRT_200m]
MTRLNLRTAIANYGHTISLKDGTIESPRFNMEHVEVSPVPTIFRRMVRNLEFDVAEMALATYICSKYYQKPFTALPIFITRSFYHEGIICNRKAQINGPDDLAGKKVGMRSYTLTPGVWTRGILHTEYGLDLDSVTWVLSGDEHVEEYKVPENVVSSSNNDLADMLLSGEVDAVIGAGAINSPDAVPLFEDAYGADKDWFNSTKIYPISHLLVVKNQILDDNPWLAEELFSMFKEAKEMYVNNLQFHQNGKVQDNDLIKMAAIVDGDPLPYGFEGARDVLETFIRFNVEQQIIPSVVVPETLFPEGTLGLI